jgi:hypothetical protein
MLTPFQQTMIEFGSTETAYFNSACHPGDWHEWQISFTPPFPREPRVIITARDQNPDSDAIKCPVVAVARNVETTGFTLAARNADVNAGEAALYWLALLETDDLQPRSEMLRMGTMDPRHFMAGERKSWSVKFSQPNLPVIPAVFLTASNLFVGLGSIHTVESWYIPFEGEVSYGNFTPVGPNAAVVGSVRQQTGWSFQLAGFNTDCGWGYCNFQYLALARLIGGTNPEGVSDAFVDSGVVGPQGFSPSCQKGDWKSWYVWFDQAFLTPPTVLVTANNHHVVPPTDNPAVVGMARYVTPNGFRLFGRNSDCAAGMTGFDWVAVGCRRGCG